MKLSNNFDLTASDRKAYGLNEGDPDDSMVGPTVTVTVRVTVTVTVTVTDDLLRYSKFEKAQPPSLVSGLLRRPGYATLV